MKTALDRNTFETALEKIAGLEHDEASGIALTALRQARADDRDTTDAERVLDFLETQPYPKDHARLDEMDKGQLEDLIDLLSTWLTTALSQRADVPGLLKELEMYQSGMTAEEVREAELNSMPF